jgi:type III pantothenate kinase
MRSGFIYGFAGLVDGIARRIVAELGERTRVIATGGLVDALAPYCQTIDEVDELLTLTGLRLIWERNR